MLFLRINNRKAPTKCNEDEDVDQSEHVVQITWHFAHSEVGDQVECDEERLEEGCFSA